MRGAAEAEVLLCEGRGSWRRAAAGARRPSWRGLRSAPTAVGRGGGPSAHPLCATAPPVPGATDTRLALTNERGVVMALAVRTPRSSVTSRVLRRQGRTPDTRQ